MRPIKKIAGYGFLAAVTSPVWYPLSLAAYLTAYSMVKVANFVTKNPGKSIGALALASTVTFGYYEVKDYLLDPKQSVMSVPNDSSSAYYFVKEGETPENISQRLSNTDLSRFISANVITGDVIKIPKRYCTKKSEGLFSEIPNLEKIILDKNTSITEYFGSNSEEVLEINRLLGLNYNDSDDEPRVVWYSPTNL